MDRIRIRGGRQLKGQIRISGAKNAALPLMVASMLTDEPLTLHNVPRLADITTMMQLLRQHGVEIEATRRERPQPRYDAGAEGQGEDHLDHGALRSRAQDARVDAGAGPCCWRARARPRSRCRAAAPSARVPVDLHIAGLQRWARRSSSTAATWSRKAPKGLKGRRYTFPKVSVGATENLMMAATLAKGTTVLDNAAREPEIADLAECLSAMGARSTGIGTETLTIEGVTACMAAIEHAWFPTASRPAPTPWPSP
jgi:UDP-N-acetylglucosamine 1-carboxyvinyltransferase